MTFSFDTGQSRVPLTSASEGMRDAWEDAVRDSLPLDHTEAAFMRAAADQIINDIWRHKSLPGVRRSFWQRSYIIHRMESLEPTAHDRLITEFAERIMQLATDLPEPSGSRDLDGIEANPPKLQKEQNYNGF